MSSNLKKIDQYCNLFLVDTLPCGQNDAARWFKRCGLERHERRMEFPNGCLFRNGAPIHIFHTDHPGTAEHEIVTSRRMAVWVSRQPDDLGEDRDEMRDTYYKCETCYAPGFHSFCIAHDIGTGVSELRLQLKAAAANLNSPPTWTLNGIAAEKAPAQSPARGVILYGQLTNDDDAAEYAAACREYGFRIFSRDELYHPPSWLKPTNDCRAVPHQQLQEARDLVQRFENRLRSYGGLTNKDMMDISVEFGNAVASAPEEIRLAARQLQAEPGGIALFGGSIYLRSALSVINRDIVAAQPKGDSFVSTILDVLRHLFDSSAPCDLSVQSPSKC